MADKMMRVGGRSDDGLAKGLRTDNDGNLKMGPAASIEPVLIAENVSTTRNIEKIVLSTFEIPDTASVAFGVSARTGGADIDLVVRDVVGGYVALGNELLMARTKFPSSNNRRISKRMNIKSTTIRLAILNHTADTVFDVYMYRYNQPIEQLTQMEFYGLNVNDKPYVAYVPVGSVFMALDTKAIYQSNGTEWRLV